MADRRIGVARLVPFERSGAPLIGALKGRIRVTGDITSTGVSWEADRKRCMRKSKLVPLA